MAGLAANGLTIRTQSELEALIAAAVQAAFPGVDFDEGPEQQMIGILAEELAIAWETLQAVYSAAYPAGAIGLSLDELSSLTGTTRPPATRSVITAADANLNAGAVLPLGSIAAVDGNPDAQFRTIAEVTNTGGAPATIPVGLESLETGPVAAPSGQLTVIVTPASGWNSITNPTDAELGTNLGTDVELRALRETELASGGTTPIDAIRADLQKIAGVTHVSVFQNRGDVTDGDGRPPHSVEAVIIGGADQDIADGLLAAIAAGIATHGATDSLTADDSQGVSHLMEWTRPTQIAIYLQVDVTVDGDTWPVDGPAQIVAALIAYQEANLFVADDVVLSALYPPAFAVSGVEDVTEIRIGIAPAPVSTANYPIDVREIADFDTSRIAVNVVTV